MTRKQYVYIPESEWKKIETALQNSQNEFLGMTEQLLKDSLVQFIVSFVKGFPSFPKFIATLVEINIYLIHLEGIDLEINSKSFESRSKLQER